MIPISNSQPLLLNRMSTQDSLEKSGKHQSTMKPIKLTVDIQGSKSNIELTDQMPSMLTNSPKASAQKPPLRQPSTTVISGSALPDQKQWLLNRHMKRRTVFMENHALNAEKKSLHQKTQSVGV